MGSYAKSSDSKNGQITVHLSDKNDKKSTSPISFG